MLQLVYEYRPSSGDVEQYEETMTVPVPPAITYYDVHDNGTVSIQNHAVYDAFDHTLSLRVWCVCDRYDFHLQRAYVTHAELFKTREMERWVEKEMVDTTSSRKNELYFC